MELISRQQAIDALRGYLVGKRCPDDGTLTCRLIENEVINKLPTIHPEHGTNLAEVGTDCISRQAAIDAVMECYDNDELFEVYEWKLNELPPIQPEIVRCKDCKYWHSGSCEYPEHVVNSQDYYVGDIETEAEHFCGYAERREVTT